MKNFASVFTPIYLNETYLIWFRKNFGVFQYYILLYEK
jgi:hypothetical protein